MKFIMENWKRFLKEDFDEEPLPDENDEVVEYILNATRVGLSPDEITQGLIEAGLTEEQALAALADAFEQGLLGDEVEVDLDELMTEEEMSRRAALGRLGAGAAGAAAIATGSGAALASNEDFQNILKGKARPFLQEAEEALARYLKDNAPDFAERLVPDIPFDADIIESLMKRTIATAIRANAEEIAECTMNFVTPDFVASLESLDDEDLQRYAEE